MDGADTGTADLGGAQQLMRATPSPADDHLAGYTSLTRYAAINYGGGVPHLYDTHGMNLSGRASDHLHAPPTEGAEGNTSNG